MWNFLPSCLRRHRRKLFVVGGVIGGVALLNSYLKKKFIEWEAKRTAELCDQFKRSSHFEGTMTTCDSALLSFAPKIKEIVCSTIDVNPVVDELKQNPPNKMQLWERLKTLVFTQVIGEMYAQCLLAVLLRVQMSILGGYVFANSHNLNANASTSSVSEHHQKYMSRIADFLANGINSLLVPIQKAVEEILKPVSLTQPLTLQDVSNIITSIRHAVSQGNTCPLPNASCYLMPSNSSNGNDAFLEKILTETRDILECHDFDQVLFASIDRGINSLMDKLSECYGFLSDAKGDFVNPHDFKAPLAKIIPMMHNVFSQHQPTEPGALVHLLLQQESLNSFAANIYESFSQTTT